MTTARRELVLTIFILLTILMTGFSWGYYVGYKAPAPTPLAVQFTPAETPAPTPTLDPHAAFAYDNMLIRVNEARLAHGLNQLIDDQYLSKQAQVDLMGNCPITSHDNFRKGLASGYFRNYTLVSEDLQSGSLTPLAAVNDLLASPTHADAMVGTSHSWTHVGIGIATSPMNCVSIIFAK